MRIRAAYSVAAALALLAAAPPALAARIGSLPGRLAQALHTPAAGTSALVADLATGAVVYAYGARAARQPASNEKLAVTWAALTALGPSFRIETDVLGEGTRAGATWTGDLVLKGYGDPTLSAGDLASLARQVRADGITHVSGAVVGDETWFDARRTAPGWKPSFLITESPPLSALIVDRGRVGRTTSRRPALAAAQLFSRALTRAGVRVDGRARLGVAGADGVDLASVDSPTVAAMVRFMDVTSDNFTAEMLTKELGAVQLGHGTTAAGLRVVRAQLAAAGVPLGGVRLADGSGLSRLDRLTAASIVSLLRVMWNDPEVRPLLLASLPVAGRTGTLRGRMRGTAAAGAVHAKTGTTDEATALSGFAAGHYVFSVLVNGDPVSWPASRAVEDRVAALLAEAAR